MPIRFQFFVSYAILGAVMPLLPVFLTGEKGFTEAEVSFAYSLSSAGLILSPALATLLADTRFDTRRILAVAYLGSGVMLAVLFYSNGVAATLSLYTVFSVCFTPTVSLLDGYFFAVTRDRLRRNRPATPYNRVRLWGTVGFIVPSLLYAALVAAEKVGGTLVTCGVVFCLGSFVSTFLLPAPPAHVRDKRRSLPSVDALKALFAPGTRWFSIGLTFALVATPIYYMYFPIYLRDFALVPQSWIGLIINIGVFLEIFYILGLGKLRSILRLKGILIAGILAMASRLVLIALFPSMAAGILTQVLHGLEILAVIVVPVLYIDRLAGDRFRNSMQGVFTMTLVGGSRILGTLIAGQIAQAYGILATFYWGAFLSVAGALVLCLKFRPIKSSAPEF